MKLFVKDKPFYKTYFSMTAVIALQNLGGKIDSMRLLADGSELKIPQTFTTATFANHAFFNWGPGHTSYPLPDEKDSVVEIRLK